MKKSKIFYSLLSLWSFRLSLLLFPLFVGSFSLPAFSSTNCDCELIKKGVGWENFNCIKSCNFEEDFNKYQEQFVQQCLTQNTRIKQNSSHQQNSSQEKNISQQSPTAKENLRPQKNTAQQQKPTAQQIPSQQNSSPHKTPTQQQNPIQQKTTQYQSNSAQKNASQQQNTKTQENIAQQQNPTPKQIPSHQQNPTQQNTSAQKPLTQQQNPTSQQNPFEKQIHKKQVKGFKMGFVISDIQKEFADFETQQEIPLKQTCPQCDFVSQTDIQVSFSSKKTIGQCPKDKIKSHNFSISFKEESQDTKSCRETLDKKFHSYVNKVVLGKSTEGQFLWKECPDGCSFEIYSQSRINVKTCTGYLDLRADCNHQRKKEYHISSQYKAYLQCQNKAGMMVGGRI